MVPSICVICGLAAGLAYNVFGMIVFSIFIIGILAILNEKYFDPFETFAIGISIIFSGWFAFIVGAISYGKNWHIISLATDFWKLMIK